MATIPLVLRTNEQRGIGDIVNEAAVAALIAQAESHQETNR